MSNTNVEGAKDVAVAKVKRLQRELATAREPLDKIAKQMEVAATNLRTNPRNLAVECYPWLVSDKIKTEIEKISSAENVLAAACDEARKLEVSDDLIR
ncbi:MAG: hypothetical protein ABSC76_18925 [Terracidiphilus sp.]|jgi:hypothetical protein